MKPSTLNPANIFENVHAGKAQNEKSKEIPARDRSEL